MAEVLHDRLYNIPLTAEILTGIKGIEDMQTIKGEDGFTPSVELSTTISNNTYGTLITIIKDEYGNKISSFIPNGKDGERGARGYQGEPGKNGIDGFTPILSVNSGADQTEISYRYERKADIPDGYSFILDNSGSFIGEGGSGLNINALMQYFGKIQLLKPFDEDRHSLFLSVQFYTDESFSEKVAGLPDFDTKDANNYARVVSYAFIGGNTDETKWVSLSCNEFDNGVGPEYDNFPFVIDLAKWISYQGLNFASVLGEKKRIYLKYSWYWYGSLLDDDGMQIDEDSNHYSDEYSLVFPNISEVQGGSGRTNESGNAPAAGMYVPMAGAENVGAIGISSDLSVANHMLVGKDVDFSEGGNETLAVGHEHHFFGKESFIAGNEANVVGAKGFYWKAIDTTSHKIYLTKQRLTRYPGVIADQGSEKQWYTSDHKYDRPYFGPKENSALSAGSNNLFVPEEGINLSGVNGKYITLWNCKYANYIRCFKVTNVLSGSVIQYEDLDVIADDDYHTYYRDKTRDPSKPYSDNQYVLFFPEMDQTQIRCDNDAYVRATTFGAAAIGEQNVALGYNSLAVGFQNRAEGHYSMSFGNLNKAQGHNTFAAGVNATVGSNNAFGWCGDGSYAITGSNRAGTFNIKPKGGIDGFYIDNKNFVSCVVEAIKSLKTNNNTAAINQIKSALGI